MYLDFDRRAKFGNYKTVDLWWRETDSKNAEMMLNIARFIIASKRWDNTSIRVLFVNNNNVGDVNVTVQGGSSSKETVRGIAAGLRREFRRGTIRLN